VIETPVLVVAVSVVPLNDRRSVVMRGVLHINDLSTVDGAKAHKAVANGLDAESLVRSAIRRPLVENFTIVVGVARDIERLSTFA